MRHKKINKLGLIDIKLVGLIIVILVVGVVIFFLIRGDLSKYISWIPVPSPSIPDDGITEGDNVREVPEGCVSTGISIEKEEGGFWRTDEQYLYVDGQKTELYWDDVDEQIKIYRPSLSNRGGTLWPDVPISEMTEAGQIIVFPEFLDEKNPSYLEQESKLPQISVLKKIDGSYYASGILCKVYSIELTSLMEYYSSHDMVLSMSKEPVRCNCGEECESYADSIIKYSDDYGILDYNLVLALMMEESKCEVEAQSSKASYGLMQINEATFRDSCKNRLSSTEALDFNSVLGKANAESNIECGIRVLKVKYNTYKNGVKVSSTYKSNTDFKKLVDSCIEKYAKYETYREFDAAFRGYNGWGCTPPGADIDYVEKIAEIKKILEQGI